MILDWFCSQCGTSGTAVALKAGEELHRVQLSHRYVSNQDWRKRWWRQNRCHGSSLRYAVRKVAKSTP